MPSQASKVTKMDVPQKILVGTIVGLGGVQGGFSSQGLTGCLVKLENGTELPVEFDPPVKASISSLLGRQVILAFGTSEESVRIVKFSDEN